eukprot:Gb_17923 [translate_table: standard]
MICSCSSQITCEFIGVTRWKVAICGEYMKSRHKSCSHGSACNFIHCFRNPGGEYDWADWDSPPPRSWLIKMDMLFGGSRSKGHDHWKLRERDSQQCHRYLGKRSQSNNHRISSRRHKSNERVSWSGDDGSGTATRREYSGGSKYSSEEERDTNSDLDQACLTTDNRQANRRSCSQSRTSGGRKRRDGKEISEDDRIIDKPHQTNDRHIDGTKMKRHHRKHSYEEDRDYKERWSVDRIDTDLANKKYSKSRRGSCNQFDSDHSLDKFSHSSNENEARKEYDIESSHKETERRCKTSRRGQDRIKPQSLDQDEIKSSRRGRDRNKSPRKHREHRKLTRMHQDSKSPARGRDHTRSHRRDSDHRRSLKRERERSKMPKRTMSKMLDRSSEEASTDSLGRWQASDDTQL